MLLVEKLKEKMQLKWRKQRISLFFQEMKPEKNTRILDIGGTPFFWDISDIDLNIVLFNTPEEVKKWSPESIDKYNVITGNALEYPFKSMEFDIVFCNSVIEHIPREEVKNFSQVVKKIAPQYWVQTPSKYFPIEAHCNLPFWWFYPNKIKKWWIRHWKQNERVFLANQMQTTHSYNRKQIIDLFPHANIVNERVFGIIKSYSVWK